MKGQKMKVQFINSKELSANVVSTKNLHKLNRKILVPGVIDISGTIYLTSPSKELPTIKVEIDAVFKCGECSSFKIKHYVVNKKVYGSNSEIYDGISKFLRKYAKLILVSKDETIFFNYTYTGFAKYFKNK
ncbi:hypothetical protein [Campylobacter phage CP81]|uniref:Uncharacterized protein n=3 Tax=Fletchervirus TaxID=1636618 RepID=G8GIS7_9CAUD|nr:hypothetical protein CaPhCPX_gp015 [Campylobacter phage CPX]YP_009623387.1 hypothetical protein FDJ37_gp154 [Campylobacter phage CP81]AET34312.1 hypothetical protein [Campylobacter phage CPX]AGS81186.1 hypothetical protein [Campylobacter phage CP8]CBZ42328.1 hypothetical protein [Campylobacter phage CP81]